MKSDDPTQGKAAGQMVRSTGRLGAWLDAYSGAIRPHNSKQNGPAYDQVRQHHGRGAGAGTVGKDGTGHRQPLLGLVIDMSQVTRAPARYDSRTRSSAVKITPASSTDLREHHLTCPCCEQGFTLELPTGSPDPGAHCFQCRQDCDWPGQCNDLSAPTHTTA